MIEDPIIKDIPNFPNYQISENGEVYNKISGHEIKQQLSTNGYLQVPITNKNNERTTVRIHRTLGLVFIPNPNNKKLIDHIDRNKTNNSVDNLRWATDSENQINRKIQTRNKSGITGVCMKTKKVDGGVYKYWFGHLKKDGKNYEKNFPYTDEGKEQAIKWRQEMEKIHHIIN